ncbi:unnamed protein product [Strongylus vulgaris]|uniref:ShKT domain-containing protein n=1 Tax=Strongylus vulgaris TaxID=40348 RepID=A0A3P7LEA1_STRVU|nr:unnamed protein product [Strongylus vulgaris]
MTQQCPRTCNRCNGATIPTGRPVQPTQPCFDRVNPQTGISDCPQVKYLCNNPIYYQLMTEHLPRSCQSPNWSIGLSAEDDILQKLHLFTAHERAVSQNMWLLCLSRFIVWS